MSTCNMLCWAFLQQCTTAARTMYCSTVVQPRARPCSYSSASKLLAIASFRTPSRRSQGLSIPRRRRQSQSAQPARLKTATTRRSPPPLLPPKPYRLVGPVARASRSRGAGWLRGKRISVGAFVGTQKSVYSRCRKGRVPVPKRVASDRSRRERIV